MARDNHWHTFELELPGSQKPGMPRDKDPGHIDQHWRHETKGSDAAGDFGNLCVRMRACVPSVRDHAPNIPDLNFIHHSSCCHFCSPEGSLTDCWRSQQPGSIAAHFLLTEKFEETCLDREGISQPPPFE